MSKYSIGLLLTLGLIACDRATPPAATQPADRYAGAGGAAASAPGATSGNSATESGSSTSTSLSTDVGAPDSTSGSGDGRTSDSPARQPSNVTKKKTNLGAGAYPSVGTMAPTSPVSSKDKSAPADVHKGE